MKRYVIIYTILAVVFVTVPVAAFFEGLLTSPPMG